MLFLRNSEMSSSSLSVFLKLVRAESDRDGRNFSCNADPLFLFRSPESEGKGETCWITFTHTNTDLHVQMQVRSQVMSSQNGAKGVSYMRKLILYEHIFKVNWQN